MEYPHRKRIRLSPAVYRIPSQPFSITLCVAGRRPVFGSPECARLAVEILETLSAASGVQLRAYCVMPDHIHILLSPNEDIGVVEFVRLFKGRVATALRQQNRTGYLWQRSFHDRAVRKEGNLAEVIQYILYNPVRAGIVEEWHAYPFSGSPHVDR